MTQPGYVVLLSAHGEIDFAARSGDAFPIRRGTQQSGFLARAAASGSACQGVTEIDRGAGVMTPQLNVDTATRFARTGAVAVDGPAPWQAFSAGRTVYSKPLEGWCADCSQSYETYETCQQCDETKCPACGCCGCGPKPLPGERMCQKCFTVQPPAAFANATAAYCESCS